MKLFLLGLLALIMRLAGIVLMVLAYCIVCPASWLEAGLERVDRARGLTIVQVGDEDE